MFVAYVKYIYMSKTEKTTVSRKAPHPDGGTYQWWKNLNDAKTNKEKTGSWGGGGKVLLTQWVSATRDTWKVGQLSSKQVSALKGIGFPFSVIEGKKNLNDKPLAGRPLQLFELNKKFKESTLTEDEQKERKKLLTDLRCKYNQGSISEKTAKMLEFC